MGRTCLYEGADAGQCRGDLKHRTTRTQGGATRRSSFPVCNGHWIRELKQDVNQGRWAEQQLARLGRAVNDNGNLVRAR